MSFDEVHELAKAVQQTYSTGIKQGGKILASKLDPILREIHMIAEENTNLKDGYDAIMELVERALKEVQL